MAVLTITPTASQISPATDTDGTAGMNVTYKNVGSTTIWWDTTPAVTADTAPTGGVPLLPGEFLDGNLPNSRSNLYAIVAASTTGLLARVVVGA